MGLIWVSLLSHATIYMDPWSTDGQMDIDGLWPRSRMITALCGYLHMYDCSPDIEPFSLLSDCRQVKQLVGSRKIDASLA